MMGSSASLRNRVQSSSSLKGLRREGGGPRCGCRGGRERRREAETGDTREAEGGGGAALMWVISYEINGAWYERGMQFSAAQHLLTGAGCTCSSSIHDLM